MSRLATTRQMLKTFAGNNPIDYWLTTHNFLFLGLMAIFGVGGQLVGWTYGGLIGFAYWVFFFGVNKSAYEWCRYNTRSGARAMTEFNHGDSQYEIYYSETDDCFVGFQPLVDHFSHPDMRFYGTPIFIGPMIFAWIQKGTMMKMTDGEFYSFIQNMGDSGLYEEEYELWESVIENSTEPQVFESVVKRGRALESL